jgi:hypothetical protein
MFYVRRSFQILFHHILVLSYFLNKEAILKVFGVIVSGHHRPANNRSGGGGVSNSLKEETKNLNTQPKFYFLMLKLYSGYNFQVQKEIQVISNIHKI